MYCYACYREWQRAAGRQYWHRKHGRVARRNLVII